MSTRNNKAYFEANAGSAIAAMCLCFVAPLPGDFVTRADIEAAIKLLGDTYTDYVQTLDSLYVDVSDPGNSFSAGNEGQVLLQQLVIETIANLNDLVFNAKQERIVILDKDDNLITLTHKYMGLDNLDQNLETFRQINNIKNLSLFGVKKGTAIKYYV